MATDATPIPRHTSRTERASRPLVLPAFTSRDVTVWALLLASFALYRAADLTYSVAHVTSVAELAIPRGFWAGGFFTVAGLIYLGVAAQRHIFMWLGHALAMVLYFALTVGAFLHLLTQQDDGPITALIPNAWWFIALAAMTVAVVIAARGVTGGAPAVWVCGFSAALVAFSPAIPLDGSRGLGPLMCVTLMHGYMAARMGPVPLTAAEIAR